MALLPFAFASLTFSLTSWCSAFFLIRLFFDLIANSIFIARKLYSSFKKRVEKNEEAFSEIPYVTIQLDLTPNPNESNLLFKMTRTLNNIAKIDFPINKLQIQIIHSAMSMDVDFSDTILRIFPQASNNKPDIDHITCNALAVSESGDDIHSSDLRNEALNSAKGEFIVLCTLDHFPSNSNFLTKSLLHFMDSQVSAVQPKLDFINEYDSVLSVLQCIEITTRVETFDYARNVVGSPLPFDCYGVWRKQDIEDCGGWHTNTGDEGVDLSYRVQLKQKKIVYEPSVILQVELPVTWDVFTFRLSKKSKGSVQNIRKHLNSIWKSELSYFQKMLAIFSLSDYIHYIPMLILFLIPILVLPVDTPKEHIQIWLFSFIITSLMNSIIPLLFARKFRSLFLLPLVPFFQAGILLQGSYKVFLGMKSDLEKPSKYGKMQYSKLWRPASSEILTSCTLLIVILWGDLFGIGQVITYVQLIFFLSSFLLVISFSLDNSILSRLIFRLFTIGLLAVIFLQVYPRYSRFPTGYKHPKTIECDSKNNYCSSLHIPFSKWNEDDLLIIDCSEHPAFYKLEGFDYQRYYFPVPILGESVVATCGDHIDFHVHNRPFLQSITPTQHHTNMIVLNIDGLSDIDINDQLPGLHSLTENISYFIKVIDTQNETIPNIFLKGNDLKPIWNQLRESGFASLYAETQCDYTRYLQEIDNHPNHYLGDYDCFAKCLERRWMNSTISFINQFFNNYQNFSTFLFYDIAGSKGCGIQNWNALDISLKGILEMTLRTNSDNLVILTGKSSKSSFASLHLLCKNCPKSFLLQNQTSLIFASEIRNLIWNL